MAHSPNAYYIPHGTYWPITGSIGLFVMLTGLANYLHGSSTGAAAMAIGFAILVIMMFGWFSEVVGESQKGLYSAQVDKTFRWAMGWFIFSEVMFFAAFFGALYYARVFSIPWLGGEGSGVLTQTFLWPEFKATWPLLQMPSTENFSVPSGIIPPFEIPLLNTILLLTSGVTITWAHHALKANDRTQLVWGMLATVALGLTFLGFQAYEYVHAYEAYNLKLDSGIYGSTFFMLTGFHGFHVTVGSIMLIVITVRCMRGHFSKENHFAFEAVAWYWHFVDVVWLGLFIFVYWL